MVYVDNMNNPTGDWLLCNMVADTVEELLVMAGAIGLKPDWMKTGQYRREHFEIALSKKKQAIKLGATEVSVAELMMLFPALANIPDKDLNMAELYVRYKDQPFEDKDDRGITVVVTGVSYCIPLCCIPDWFGIKAKDATVEGIREFMQLAPNAYKPFMLYP